MTPFAQWLHDIGMILAEEGASEDCCGVPTEEKLLDMFESGMSAEDAAQEIYETI